MRRDSERTEPREPARQGRQHAQADADRAAADRRQADLDAAAKAKSAQREAEDKDIAQRRLDEDTALADTRREEDRVLASARSRLVTAAAAVQAATDSVAAGGDPADLAVANTELQKALRAHLETEPEPAAPVAELGWLIAGR